MPGISAFESLRHESYCELKVHPGYVTRACHDPYTPPPPPHPHKRHKKEEKKSQRKAVNHSQALLVLHNWVGVGKWAVMVRGSNPWQPWQCLPVWHPTMSLCLCSELWTCAVLSCHATSCLKDFSTDRKRLPVRNSWFLLHTHFPTFTDIQWVNYGRCVFLFLLLFSVSIISIYLQIVLCLA